MAFAEIQLPPTISYGAVGGPVFHTTVLTLVSGYERRNSDWSLSRAMYDVAQGLRTQQELNVLIKFFYARNGKAIGFRFKDWSDFQIPFPGDVEPLIFTTVGSTTPSVFQLVKVYGDAGGSYTRPIVKPVANTLQLTANGIPLVAGTDFTVDTTTGLVTLSTAQSATTGVLINILYCEFDVPVRFDIDDMKVSLNDYDNYTWGQIALVELRNGD